MNPNMKVERLDTKATALRQRYRLKLFLSLLLLLSSAALYGWGLARSGQQSLMADLRLKSETLQMSLNTAVDMALAHVFVMQQSVESRLLEPLLADDGWSERWGQVSPNSPADAPWDDIPEALWGSAPSLFIDPSTDLTTTHFYRDLAAVSSILATAPATHQHYQVFQWSYYYDAQSHWSLLYPRLARADLLAYTNAEHMSDALQVVFEAGGTFPVKLSGPDKNPDRELVWSRPYTDAAGQGLMVSLLAPVYLADTYVGAVGTDVTLSLLNRVLKSSPVDLNRVLIVDADSTLLADTGENGGSITRIQRLDEVLASDVAEHLTSMQETSFKASDATWIRLPIHGTNWSLLVRILHQDVNTHLATVLRPYVVLSLALLVALIGLAWIQDRRYMQPALRLVGYLDTLDADPESPAPPVPRLWRHWFDQVADAARERKRLLQNAIEHASQLEERVQERTEELSLTLENLRHAQSDLIQSEKLAALGSLVAGVAHELNTPIGNAVTVSSTLTEAHAEFQRRQQHSLSRKMLESFVATVGEAATMLMRNLERAAGLVSSFKQVAVDQNSHQRRPFLLAEILSEVHIIMAPGLRKSGVDMHIECEPDIQLDSYPGALTQALMILISNAITHAFEGLEHRNIAITATSKDNDVIEIIVADDGLGVESAMLNRIFEPFYTSKLGKGGSGLGMHIFYNLVTATLGGKTQAESPPGQGLSILIEIPALAPSITTTDTAEIL